MRAGTYRISTDESTHREANVVRIDIFEQLFGGRRRLRLVPLATALALAAAAPVGAAGPDANGLISRQYQAESGDTATWARVAVRVGLTARRAGSHGDSTTYRRRNARYQLRSESLSSSARLPGYIVELERDMSAPISRYNRLQIAPRIRPGNAVTDEPRPISSDDARLLVRLGLGLGLAYIVFLAAWFWRTRNRTEDAAARVVRF